MRRPTFSVFLIALALCLIAVSPAINAKSGNSLNAKLCYKDGWQTLMRVDRTLFLNEGECTSYGAQGGTILAIPTVTPTSTVTNTPTNTATPTNTPVPPTNTPTDTPTNTPVPPTNTPTDTPTNTPIPPTNTPTDTPTNTPVPPTATPSPMITATVYIFDPQLNVRIEDSYCDQDFHVLVPRQVMVSGTGWAPIDVIRTYASGTAIGPNTLIDMVFSDPNGAIAESGVAYVLFSGGNLQVTATGDNGGTDTVVILNIPPDLGAPPCAV